MDCSSQKKEGREFEQVLVFRVEIQHFRASNIEPYPRMQGCPPKCFVQNDDKLVPVRNDVKLAHNLSSSLQ